MNFGSNAIQYGRKGGRVTFAASVISPESVRVMVSGVGSGIPADSSDEALHVLQGAQRQAGYSGSGGIGLVIARHLAELMRGRVAVHHIWNRGLQLWVDLPASDQAAGTREPLVA